jgi:predicted nucleic acid-binding protein
MNGSYLVDTNIFVYAFDTSEPAQQERAKIFSMAWQSRELSL